MGLQPVAKKGGGVNRKLVKRIELGDWRYVATYVRDDGKAMVEVGLGEVASYSTEYMPDQGAMIADAVLSAAVVARFKETT